MDRNAYRDGSNGGADLPDAYWRRRVITLALGMGLLGVLAWAFSGGGAKSTSSGSSAVLPASAGTGSAQTGSASAGPSVLPGIPALSPSSSRLRPAAYATQRPSASTTSAQAVPPGRRCSPSAVVLSLFTDRTRYGPSQYPRFDVYAVSTYQGSCAFDPGQMQIVVLSSNRIVWDSADCYHGSQRIAYLTRGVPAQAAVTWNRAVTLPGCQVLASARIGSYTVQARTSTVASPARAFKLTG